MAEKQTPGLAVRTRSIDHLEGSDTADSPARGRQTRTALLQKLRPPPLVHAWDFWLEKEINTSTSPPRHTTTIPSNSSITSTTTSANATSAALNAAIPTTNPQTITTPHNTTLTNLHSITNVQHFWSLFNNFSFSTLPPRVSVHLFHATVTPTWEDARNTHGGSWTFRLPRSHGGPFFRALAVLAIGEQLQEAVCDETKKSFRDDICGIGFSVKSEKMTSVSIWNRDAGNEEGRKRLLEMVLRNVPKEVRPDGSMYYYKAHHAHAGFVAGDDTARKGAGSTGAGKADSTGAKQSNGITESKWSAGPQSKTELEAAQDRSQDVSDAVNDLSKEYEKVRKILEEVKIKDAEMEEKFEAEAERLEGEGNGEKS